MTTDNLYQVLIADDDEMSLETLEMILAPRYPVVKAKTGQEAVDLVAGRNDIAVAVLDIRMPDMDGLEAARRIREINPDIPVIFHTGYAGDYDEAEIEAGLAPHGYIEKGEAVTKLQRAVRTAYETFLAKADPVWLVSKAEQLFGMVGQSPAMLKVYRQIVSVSRSDASVLILGESGTGKELVARALHDYSSRGNEMLGIVNCNHKPTELVETEIFGYKKGAYTGASQAHEGLFYCADKGSIFLDEIGDLSSTSQELLLRVLATGEYHPVGDSADVRKADVRVICATNKDLAKMVKGQEFRQDLFYRLNSITIELPPLRDRENDIILLAKRFRDRLAQSLPYKYFAPEALPALLEHDWSGSNVRELENTIEALIVMTDSDVIYADDIRRQLRINEDSPGGKSAHSLPEMVDMHERKLIMVALHETGGNVLRASKLLSIDRSNLARRIERLAIDTSVFASPSRE